jgi:hypothetical protein
MKLSVILKQLAIATALVSLIILTACGSGTSTASPTSVTGNWSVTLFDSNNAAAYVFTTTLNQQIASPATTSPITGSNFNLTTGDKTCFNTISTATQTGVFTVNDVFDGLTTNTARLRVGDAGENSDSLSMTGTFTTNAISGPWTLGPNTASAPPIPSTCVTSGTFLMTRM